MHAVDLIPLYILDKQRSIFFQANCLVFGFSCKWNADGGGLSYAECVWVQTFLLCFNYAETTDMWLLHPSSAI